MHSIRSWIAAEAVAQGRAHDQPEVYRDAAEELCHGQKRDSPPARQSALKARRTEDPPRMVNRMQRILKNWPAAAN
jgi:hypothetical protein